MKTKKKEAAAEKYKERCRQRQKKGESRETKNKYRRRGVNYTRLSALGK